MFCPLCGAADYFIVRSALMQHLYPRYRDAFAGKCNHFEPLLTQGAEVLEVGSHLGAFLEVAENWGWKPIGLDIGRDTSAFAQRQGGTVKSLSLEEYAPTTKPDAIFIWNCFEQLEEPWATLLRARRLVSRHGLVVLRVPNADFYREPALRPAQRLRALGYNNLLGFPYLIGYNLQALERLLVSTGFETVASFAASLLTPPNPEINGSLRKEWKQTRTETEQRGALNGPWIEIVGRAADSPRF